MRRAGHERDPLVTAGEQVRDGRVGARHVVDGDGAHVRVGVGVVQQHHPQPPVPQPVQPGAVEVGRGDQHAHGVVLGELPQIALLLVGQHIGVAQGDGLPGGVQEVLGAPRQIGQEGVAHVEDDQSDDAAPAPAELPGGRIGHVPQDADGLLDPLAGGRGDLLRTVDHIGDGGDRDSGA